MENESLIEIINRNYVRINGVENVLSMEEDEFYGIVTGTKIIITGNKLELKRFDMQNKIVEIQGEMIDKVSFTNKKSKNFFKRLVS